MIPSAGKLLVLSTLAAFVLAGCGSTRPGEAPPVPIAADWSHPVSSGSKVISTNWWEQYEIPALTEVVQSALASNANLAVLAERVDLARAQSRSDIAGSMPTANATTALQAGKERSRQTQFQTVGLLPWSAAGFTSWELDWLGKWRERKRAAHESIKASQADLNAGRLLLTAEVVSGWFQLQQHHHEAGIINRSLDRQQQILAIYRDRQSAGLVEAAVIERQEAGINELQRQLTEAKMRQQIAARRLDRLQGHTAQPGDYPRHPFTGPPPAPDIPNLLPAEALRRRPDLQAAEARLRSAWSIARTARLDLYPSLDLRLGGVTMTGSLTDPFRSWMTEFGPRLQIPLWDPNRRAATRTTSARARLAAAEYRAAAIRAVEEIETALITQHRTREQLDHASEASRHAENIVARTSDRLQAGLVSQIELLEDQRRALNAALTVIRLQARHLATLATLHRVLGI